MTTSRRRRAATALLLAAGLTLGVATPAAAAAPPALSSVAPEPAPIGTLVTLTGSSLSGATTVAFTGVGAAPFTVTDDTALTTTLPAGAVDGVVTVTTPDGSASLPFDVDEPPPAVDGLSARAGDRTVALRWVRPVDAVDVVVRRADAATAPESPADGQGIAVGSVDQVTDTGLVNGATYTYAVWTRDAAGSFGPRVTVTVVPTVPAASAVRIGVSAATVTHGAAVRVSGVVTRADGLPEPGAVVVLLARPRGAGSFAGVMSAVTDASGAVRFLPRVLQHTEYLLRRPGDAFAAESRSSVATVLARHGLSTRLSAGVVAVGGAAVVDGRVAPRVPGLQVRLERQTSAGWQTAAYTTLDSTGAYRFPVRTTRAGEQVLRVVTTPGAGHLPAVGATVRLLALDRTLREGMSGDDVLAVERRLTALRYDVGPMSGYFDYDTRLAVMAFQKVHGLARTGVLDGSTRTRLANPMTPRLRYPVTGLSVEIDLTKQVLYLGRGGSIQRILPVSSGNNQLYTVDGVTSRAVTPVGSYRIERKIDGVRVSRLGELFQPAYFIGGYAIHGSPSVPAYPASHGCVRVTKSAMSRLFPLLPVGTPVHLYY